MLNSGAIHPSQSAWCNAVVLVWKKDGGLHFCIDFQCLNACRKKESYPLPRIHEALESLVGAGYFSCLDLKSRFWQIKMDESSKQYTVLTIGNLGFFECDHMQFGLCNAPATFQWPMQNCLGELNLIYCLIYLDDIVVFSHTAEEHLHHLCIVFDWFREHSLKLKPLKCNFFREEITYLVHRVSKDGVWPSNLNLKAIAECALSQTYSDVHAFLGLVGHYRFIKGFACIAQPLNDHLTGEGAQKEVWACGHFQRMPWRLLKCWSRHVWQLLCWPLPTLPNHFSWRWMCPRTDSGSCCPRSRWTDDLTQFPMAAEPLHLMRRTTI